MDDLKTKLWIWFASLIDEKNGVSIKKCSSTSDIRQLYEMDRQGLTKGLGYTNKEADLIISSRGDGRIEKCQELMDRKKVKLLTVEDDGFPQKLREIKDGPKFLFFKGTIPENTGVSVGIVGARACSNYGREMAKKIALDLSLRGVNVISGMARGIDTYSHLGALAGPSPTYAILGCGVDVCYPSENIELYEEILEKGGGIISEYLPGTSPLSWHFPMRNRIISGLSDKIVVVEAKEKSGSLITVDWALEQGKDIFAVPGRAKDVLSAGCNKLIKTGAGVITDVEDLLEDYDSSRALECSSRKSGLKSGEDKSILGFSENKLEEGLTGEKLVLYRALDIAPQSMDKLIEKTGFSTGLLANMLIEMQLLGIVGEVGKNMYVKNIV